MLKVIEIHLKDLCMSISIPYIGLADVLNGGLHHQKPKLIYHKTYTAL